MVQMDIQLPSQTRDASGHILTHGYVHGHVHQHRDHVHIHGHIHNHDHLERLSAGIDCADANGAESTSTNMGVQSQNALSDLECKELDHSFDLCDDIFCDELDDCYYYDCDRPADAQRGKSTDFCGSGSCEFPEAPECCEDENCLMDPADNLGTDPGCMQTAHHDNSLCDYQKPRLTIFENLIHNVHQNIEQYNTVDMRTADSVGPDYSGLSSETTHSFGDPEKPDVALNPQFHIHFPHHCHQEPQQKETMVPDLQTPHLGESSGESTGDHTVHQSCFHAKLPLTSQKSQLTLGDSKVAENKFDTHDYDFFVQFNNFKQIFDQPKVSEIKEPILNQTYSCQWENCLQPVDNQSLVNHLLGSHLGHEHPAHATGPVKLECEWDDCGFVDENLKSFLDHLHTHREGPGQERKEELRIKEGISLKQEMSPLLTPSSISVCESPTRGEENARYEPFGKVQASESVNIGQSMGQSMDQNIDQNRGGTPQMPTHRHGLSISGVRICPKKTTQADPADPSHTCKWQIGSENGKPVICNLTHATDGELQEHLKHDHIGRGKSIYHCCWHGCERNHGKPFAQRQKLFRHIHIHTGHKPCTCHECGAQFAVPSMLKQHQRIHSGEKPYKCQECGRCFATSSSLAIHTRVHTDSRPLECTWPGCGKRFRESSNLAKHIRTHSTKYVCEQCGKEFEKRRSLTRHAKTHAVGEVNGNVGDVRPLVERGEILKT